MRCCVLCQWSGGGIINIRCSLDSPCCSFIVGPTVGGGMFVSRLCIDCRDITIYIYIHKVDATMYIIYLLVLFENSRGATLHVI